MHGEFQDARPEELGEQHAVAVPGRHHAPGRRVPQRQLRLPPGCLDVARPGRRAGQAAAPRCAVWTRLAFVAAENRRSAR